MADPLIGGKYEVIAELGRGGFGTVFKARHAGLDKPVAIKVLHTALLVDQVNRARFEVEARAGANLSHPNLVSVFDYGFTEKEEPYLVMEFVEGTSLDQFLSCQKPTSDDLLTILIQVGKAIRYLHDSNIIHRDLKTSNILVQDIGGERYARLLDLGIAKVFSPAGGEGNATLTSTGMIFGSPACMSPEQCEGRPVDARSDIYSFGCVIYQCLAGEVPFSGENPLQVILKHLHEVPKQLPYKTQREYELTQVVSKCLAKEPGQRYQHMKELLDALQKIASVAPNEKAQIRQDTLSRSYTLPSAPSTNPQQMQMIGVVVAVVLFVIAAALAVPLIGQFSKSKDAAITNPQNGTPAAVVQPVPAAQSTQSNKSAADPLTQQKAELEAAADKLRSERMALEKASADKAAERLAEERVALEKAADRLAQERAAAERSPLPDAATRAAYLERAQALAKATSERAELTKQALRSFDQSTQSMSNGNMSLRQYNDQMARQNGLRP